MKTLTHEILSELRHSKTYGTVVGLRLKENDQLIVSSVIALVDDRQVVIEDTSVYGNRISKNHFRIDEIHSVLRFKANYHDPEFVKLRKIKKAIHVLKEDYGQKKEHLKTLIHQRPAR